MTTAAPERSRAHRVAGIAVGVLLGLLALAFAFLIYAQLLAYLDPTTGLPLNCRSTATSGTHCSATFLNTMVIVGYAICFFGFAIPVGLMVVRLIQRRRAWFWPLISLVVVYAGFFLVTAVLGTQYLPVARS